MMSKIFFSKFGVHNRANMFAVTIVLFFCVLHKIAAESVPITINQATIESSTGLHPIIDASPGSNSLKEHLASIVKLNAPLEALPPENEQPIPNIQGVPDIPDAPEPALAEEANENSDLKADTSLYYGFGYGGYRSPYYQQYGNPYYSNYWSYGNYYNRPYYPYYSNGYYRRNDYYPGQYHYGFNPYRRRYSSFYY